MSSQHEEEEFDFSYVFEYSGRPVTGGFSKQNDGLYSDCMSCVLLLLCSVMGSVWKAL